MIVSHGYVFIVFFPLGTERCAIRKSSEVDLKNGDKELASLNKNFIVYSTGGSCAMEHLTRLCPLEAVENE